MDQPQHDDIDQIMDQMQTLNVKKNEVEVQPVSEKTKVKVLRWLVDDVKLISASLSISKLIVDLPKFCRNGVLFGDLLNRLGGRGDVIKGMHRAPKNMTAISANYDKVLGYLKEFPRFSSRYLWAHQKMIEGNTDVIWGLLDDIWHWHFNKISAHDPSNKVKSENDAIDSLTGSQHRTHSTTGPQTAQAKNLSILRASSSSRRTKVDSIGQGPPKMRDYMRNGEQARNGLQATRQSME